MHNDIEDRIKEMLLQDLIEKMGDQHGDRMKPEGLEVQVAAPDKKHLSEGLDKAKGALPDIPEPGEGGEEDDESRLMALLDQDDDDEDERR